MWSGNMREESNPEHAHTIATILEQVASATAAIRRVLRSLEAGATAQIKLQELAIASTEIRQASELLKKASRRRQSRSQKRVF
jgi:hypothetical protein